MGCRQPLILRRNGGENDYDWEVTGAQPDSFSFDITIRHNTEDPAMISSVLGIVPNFQWAAGEMSSIGVHKAMRWEGTLTQGAGEEDFHQALRGIIAMLKKQREFFRELVAGGGEIDVTGNFDLEPSVIPDAITDGEHRTRSKVFEMVLYPEFVAALCAIPAALQIRVWDGR
jgi:hypothetical protein